MSPRNRMFRSPKFTSKTIKRTAMFTFVGGMLVINPAFAQDATQATQGQVLQSQRPAEDATTLDSVVVTGLRNSLNQSMELKREAAGVVDAISSEDIGKFPDTNLAESLQRITGISIERRDGEGAQITARGFGPQFNMRAPAWRGGSANATICTPVHCRSTNCWRRANRWCCAASRANGSW